MKVTSVDLYSSNSTKHVNLSYRDPTSLNPYQVKAITGLDADQITPRYYGSGSGQKFYDLVLQQRDIAVKVGFNPRPGTDETISSLRDELYRLISSSRTGAVSFHLNNGEVVVAGISGFVSKMENAPFTDDPETTITISCEDPMFRGVTPVSVDVMGLDPLATVITDNLSTAWHGFSFVAEFTADAGSFKITDGSDDWMFEIVPVSSDGFKRFDHLYFSSNYNAKELYLVRGETTIHLADVLTMGSIWPILFPGDNTLVCTEGMQWNSIAYYPAYWGV